MSTASAPKKSFIVKQDELPLCCPTPAVQLWSAHPRVYIPLAEKGRATCPYCGTEYILEGNSD